MSIHIVESRDSFQSYQSIYKGLSPLAWADTRMFSGTLDTYIVGIHGFSSIYTRIETASKLYTETSADPPNGDSHGVATHILGEFNNEIFGVYIDTDNAPYAIHVSSYPEFKTTWTTYSGVNHLPIDVEHPEHLESPRFLVGYGENVPEKILVVNIVSGLDITGRHATNWLTPLASGAVITDLETVRLI